MGVKLVEITNITHNGTDFVIGEIQWIQTNEEAIQEDGFIDLNTLETVAVSGLDSYHSASRLFRLSYAKPDKALEEIPLKGADTYNE